MTAAALFLLAQTSTFSATEAEAWLQRAEANLENATADRAQAEAEVRRLSARREDALARYHASKQDKRIYSEYQELGVQLRHATAAVDDAKKRAAEAQLERGRADAALKEANASETPAKPQPSPHPTPPTAAYVISESTQLRVSPSATATSVKSLSPLDVVRVREAKPGWIHIEGGGGKAEPFEGWIQGKTENLLPDPFENAIWRAVKMKDEAWPLAVKLDVMRKKPRPGFTKEQVLTSQMDFLGKGEPRSKKSIETAAGTKESWVYPGMVVHFAGEKVTEIERLE